MSDPLPQPSEGFRWLQPGAARRLPATALVCGPLLELADHLFTTRAWTLGRPTPGADDAGWHEIADALGVAGDRLRRVRQVHGAAVVRADGEEDSPPEADVIVTDRPELAVAVQAADCVPLLIADPRTGAVAAAHAGWRGLAAHVPGETVRALAREFGSRPETLVAAAGPSIGPCCYEVGDDVRQEFAAAFPHGTVEEWFKAGPRTGKWVLDTWASARAQLEAAGIPAKQVFTARLCTACLGSVLCSFRRDGGPAGRIAGAIRPRAR